MELATPDAFLCDPGLVWQFYSYRRIKALQAKPNKGHLALAELSKLFGPDRFLTLTQNVDGLSLRAKHRTDSLLHLHGDLFSVKCTSFSCSFEETNFDRFLTPALRQAYEENDEEKQDTDDDGFIRNIPEDELPQCPKCRGLLRPGVVWFGEPLPLRVIDRADQFVTSDQVDLIMVIGTSGVVWPAAGYVEQVVMRGGKVAVFNIEAVEDANWMFTGDAAEWLPKALEPIVGRIRK